jgi:predicted transcriptional regulator
MGRASARWGEQMGALLEVEGFSRIAGRLFGRLLLSDAPLSLDALAQALDVSKASVSTETRALERRGVVERVTLPGDRRCYYRVVDELPIRTMELRLERMRRFRALLQNGRTRPGTRPVRQRLADMDAAYSHLLRAVDRALAEWRRR